MRRLLVLLVAVLLVAAACGGGSTDDGSDDVGNDAAPSTEAPDDGGGNDDSPPATEAEDSGSGGSGPSSASVTIGDDTYEFSTEGALVAQCLSDLFGIMSVQLPLADGGDGFISITALHEGTDPAVVEQINSVLVEIGDDKWTADPESVSWNGDPETAAMSYVESVEVSGSTLNGTASFVGFDNTTRERMTVIGTFEATCGEERTS